MLSCLFLLFRTFNCGDLLQSLFLTRRLALALRCVVLSLTTVVLSLTTVVLVVSIALSCLFLLFKAFDFSVNAFGVFGALHGAIFYTVVLVVSIALSCFFLLFRTFDF